MQLYLVVDPIDPMEGHIVEASSADEAARAYARVVDYDSDTLDEFLREARVTMLTPDQQGVVRGEHVRPQHERVLELMDEFCEEYITLEPREDYDPCIVGIVRRFNDTVLAYSTKAILEMLTQKQGMTLSEAEEWFGFNTVGAWLGDMTPIFVCDDICDYPGAGPWEVPAAAIDGPYGPLDESSEEGEEEA